MADSPEARVLLPALRAAARLARRVQQTLVTPAHKAGQEPVTVADYGSQALLCRAIQQHFPQDAVIAEERASDFLSALPPEGRQQVVRAVTQGLVPAATQRLADALARPVDEEAVCAWLDFGRDRQAPRAWAIDPLDGTLGFLAGRRYTVAVALLLEGAPVFCAMACPAYPHPGGQGLLFYVEAGRALMCPLEDESAAPTPIHVSAADDPAQARALESVEAVHTDHAAFQRIRAALGADEQQVIRMDGQDKYAAVACGDAEYYLRVSPTPGRREKLWDHAAGALLVTAAGGRVTDLDGRPLDFSAGATLARNRGIIASNGALHEPLLAAVRHALPPLGAGGI